MPPSTAPAGQPQVIVAHIYRTPGRKLSPCFKSP
jgi:hypothetical protein